MNAQLIEPVFLTTLCEEKKLFLLDRFKMSARNLNICNVNKAKHEKQITGKSLFLQ